MKINKELIKLLIKKKSLKQKEVAEKIGVSPQDFNNWMFRGIFPHFNRLEKLAEVLEVDVESLYSESDVLEPASAYGKKMTFAYEDLIPFYELDPHVRLVNLWKSTSSIEPKDHVYIPGLNADLIFPYYGKGMEPQVENGDWIALRKVADLSFFNYGTLHAVVTKEQVIVRYLKKGDKKSTIKLCAQSEFSDTIELPQSGIRGLFAVVSIIKKNFI